MTTYTAWYLTIASILNGQVIRSNGPDASSQSSFLIGRLILLTLVPYSVFQLQAEDVVHSGPTKLVLYFTGATNILYTFGGHAVTV